MGKLRPPRGTGKGPLGTPAPTIKLKTGREIQQGVNETRAHFLKRVEELKKKLGLK